MDRGGRDGLFSDTEQQVNRLYVIEMFILFLVCAAWPYACVFSLLNCPLLQRNSRVVSCNLEMGGLKDGIFDLATKRFGKSVAVGQLKCGRSMSMADLRPCRNVY
jgi:hypothetical protein